jgi:hypothetical protein
MVSGPLHDAVTNGQETSRALVSLWTEIFLAPSGNQHSSTQRNHETRINASYISSDRLKARIQVFFLAYAHSGCHRPVGDGVVQAAITIYDKCVCRFINPLTPNDPYSGRTAPLTSKVAFLYIYSTNIGTVYFKHGIYSPFFPLQNAVCFIILTFWFLYYSHFMYRVC